MHLTFTNVLVFFSEYYPLLLHYIFMVLCKHCKITLQRDQPTAITEYDQPLIRRLIEKVTINKDKFTVIL